jgi:hypothetical protein
MRCPPSGASPLRSPPPPSAATCAAARRRPPPPAAARSPPAARRHSPPPEAPFPLPRALSRRTWPSRTAAAHRPARVPPHPAAQLAAWCWELNAKLTGPATRKAGAPYSDDVLRALGLPAAEVAWLGTQRSRPLQLQARIRAALYAQLEAGTLPWHVHQKLDLDVRDLDLVVGGCERLFSSPVPPTMSRHAVRCLALFLAALPLVLAGSMAPAATAAWVFAAAYIYVGIEELGVQARPPRRRPRRAQPRPRAPRAPPPKALP